MKRIALLALVIMAALVVKLTLFSPAFNKEEATRTARWVLESASNDRRFDLTQFGQPNHVSGDDENGYLFTWYFTLNEGGTRLDVIVSVSKYDTDFTGFPFLLDCRTGHNEELLKSGFGYLCRK